MAGGFLTPVDIANRALQVLRRPAIYRFEDVSVEGHETQSCYDQLRQAELRRSVWRFATRRVVLRAMSPTSQILIPAAWSALTTYIPGDIVADLVKGESWICRLDALNKTPGSGSPYWDSYFGPTIVDAWQAPIEPPNSSTAGRTRTTSYFSHEIVYKTPGNGTYTIYRSLTNGNSDDPEGVDDWIDDIIYTIGQVAVYQGINYQSLTNLNFNHVPASSPSQWTTSITSALVSNSWRVVVGTLSSAQHLLYGAYPMGLGPSSDSRARCVYRLPAGFLRQAPTDPKADFNPFLGAPSGNIIEDWVWEDQYIVSHYAGPIMLRFVADVQYVPEFDALFSVGLATRMAIELAPRLADGEHLATILATAREEYARTITEARTINGIETGPIAPAEDEYIVCRL